MRWTFFAVFLLASITGAAQESALHADFRRESEQVKENCGSFGIKTIGSCAYTLFTDHPLHIAVGSIAPQNGFGFGGAFVTHYTPDENWRLSWNVDAVGATSGSWRAGAYMKIIHTPPAKIVVVKPTAGHAPSSKPLVHPYTVFNLYAQSISLQKIFFFGLGPDSQQTNRSLFGMQETIVGGSAIKPVTEWGALRAFHLSLDGEINGRFVDIRGNHGQSSPSIEQLFTNASAPGLATQPGFLQLGEGLRIEPDFFDDQLRLNYSFKFQQFLAPSDSTYSFRRWTLDLDHQLPIYRNQQSIAPKSTNGPDSCAQAVGATKCPPISRNRYGTVGFRFLLSESISGAGSTVPFYLQPTLGGSDVNGNPWLSSFDDYRFRGPNLIALRESFEHSIWGPFGAMFIADQGKVALSRGDVDFNNLRHSFAVGATLRAGGFPAVYLLFAWGGGEGNHTVANVSTTLLGGSARPSLF